MAIFLSVPVKVSRPSAATPLVTVHAAVCQVKQAMRIAFFMRMGRAMAGPGEGKIVTAQCRHRLFQHIIDPGQVAASAGDGKFIAAQAMQQGLRPQARSQNLGKPAQQRVAARMAMRIV